MRVLRLFLSSAGRLPPSAFVVAAVLLYAVAVGAQGLTLPAVTMRAGLWPFVAAQGVLAWMWYALHAKRLRDAGRPAGLAGGIALLYGFGLALLVIVASWFTSHAGGAAGTTTASGLNLILIVSVVGVLLAATPNDLGWWVIALLTVLAFMPLVVAVAFTLWAASRPSRGKHPA